MRTGVLLILALAFAFAAAQLAVAPAGAKTCKPKPARKCHAKSKPKPKPTLTTTTTTTTAMTTATVPVDPGPPYSPALAKPSWADDPSQTPTPEFGEWPVDRDRFVSATNARVLMLFVDYPNAPGTIDPKALYDSLVPPALKWFAAASYGRARVTVDYLPRWYRMPQPSSAYPVASEHNDPTAMHDVAATALSLADNDVDFSKYDAVFLWGSANNFTVTQYRAWPGDGVVFDRKEIDHVEFEDGGIPSGTWDDNGHPMDATATANLLFTHELLHHMGTPDSSYKPDVSTPYDFSYVGGWDMQDSPAGISHGADYLAWNKWRLGWLDASQLRGLDRLGTIQAILTPVETAGGAKAVVVPVTSSLAYVVELRRRLGNDAKMTCDEGVLVYTVDSTKRNGLAPVFVEPAHPSTDASRIATCGLKYAAPFQVGETFEDANVKVEVLSSDGTNDTVRVTRK